MSTRARSHLKLRYVIPMTTSAKYRGARWPIGRALDWNQRSVVRDLPPPCCVLEQDTFTLQKVLLNC